MPEEPGEEKAKKMRHMAENCRSFSPVCVLLPWVTAERLSLSTVDSWSWVILHCGGCSVHCGVFCSISSLYLCLWDLTVSCDKQTSPGIALAMSPGAGDWGELGALITPSENLWVRRRRGS